MTNQNHCIHQNLSTFRLWCCLCDTEVFLCSQQLNSARTWSEEGDLIEVDESVLKNRKPKGLQNIGNTCYMNAALQALCNTTPLSQYFLQCFVTLNNQDKKPSLSRNFQRLIQEMWQRNGPGYIVPSGILYGIRNVHPMFRGYQQHDTQEFLRCFMDQLHEELKEPIPDSVPHVVTQPSVNSEVVAEFSDEEEGNEDEDIERGEMEGDASSGSQSEAEYETCDSGVSERSSLSDEGERKSMKRKHSHSSSPPTRCKVTTRSLHTYKQASQQSSPVKPKRKTVKYKSIISDLFDGKLLSSVQCLTCNKVSTRIETFQDLSLPIPSRDHVTMLHQGSIAPQSISNCSDVYKGKPSWMSWIWEWMKSWFWGPTVSLHDCLAAFFSADELKGDNMYSCEKCSKLRNGVKYSKVLDLPEILCIHLKRFRHELAFSSKISSFVSFPLTGLNMRPYLHKDCKSEVTSYDLTSVICHHGTAGGGHYTCYALSPFTGDWYELDDQCVTQVAPETVSNVECYVLFYRKSNERMQKIRNKVGKLMSHKKEPSLMEFYVSKQWMNKLSTFAEPGPIDNSDFLCAHGGVHPLKVPAVEKYSKILSQNVWEYLYSTFGGGPACNRLYLCSACQQEQEALRHRTQYELSRYLALNQDFQQDEFPPVIYGLSMLWFRQWQSFVQNTNAEPPGPIDNTPIISIVNGQKTLKLGANYGQVSEELWNFFKGVYGGGPELILRQFQRGPSRASFSSGISSEKETVSVQPSKAKSVESLPNNMMSVLVHSNPTIGAGGTSKAPRVQSASSDNIAVKSFGNSFVTSHRKQQSLGSLKIDKTVKSEEVSETVKRHGMQRREGRTTEDTVIMCRDNFVTGDGNEREDYSYCPAFTPEELDSYVPFKKTIRHMDEQQHSSQ
ncbi:UNVERIFIED_CONTAM: hypothetical protein PYX00_004437 [Menopon gallinae]